MSFERMLHQCLGTKEMSNVVQAQIQPLSRPWQRLQRSRPMMAMTAMHIWLMHWLHCRSMAMMKQKKSITVGAYLACLVTKLCTDYKHQFRQYSICHCLHLSICAELRLGKFKAGHMYTKQAMPLRACLLNILLSVSGDHNFHAVRKLSYHKGQSSNPSAYLRVRIKQACPKRWLSKS